MGPAIMTVTEITLLVLRCHDIERSRAFYEAIGLLLTAEQHGTGPRHYSARIGTAVLELYPYAGADTRGLRLGLRVSDLSTVLASVERLGGRLLRVGSARGRLGLSASGASIPSTALLEDPDGHQIELAEEK